MIRIRRNWVRTCLWLAVLAVRPVASAHAVQGRHDAHPAVTTRQQGALALDGRVVAVRRLSREVTVRTAQGSVYRIAIMPGAQIRAPRGAGLDAVRSGVVIHLDAVPGRNGGLFARSVSVR